MEKKKKWGKKSKEDKGERKICLWEFMPNLFIVIQCIIVIDYCTKYQRNTSSLHEISFEWSLSGDISERHFLNHYNNCLKPYIGIDYNYISGTIWIRSIHRREIIMTNSAGKYYITHLIKLMNGLPLNLAVSYYICTLKFQDYHDKLIRLDVTTTKTHARARAKETTRHNEIGWL